MTTSKSRHSRKLTPRHNFALNPYVDARFTRCPKCKKGTKVRKLPLFIHVDPFHPIALNKTCRYCPDCDLLIAHQDELEAVLLQMFPNRDPATLPDQYQVMGTVERRAYRDCLKSRHSIEEILQHIHYFKAVWKLGYRPAGWYPDDSDN